MAGLYLNHVKVAEESGGVVSLPNTVQFNNLKIGGTEVINSNRQIQNITGIDFSPSSGTGTPSSNILDDYEEGIYQVTLTPDGGSFDMDTNRDTFEYTKIGNVCHVFGYARVSSVSSPTGSITFNLPFTSAASTEYSGYTFGICIPENITTINSNELGVQVGPSTSIAQIRRTGGGGSFANWISFANYFATNTNIRVMLTYKTA